MKGFIARCQRTAPKQTRVRANARRRSPWAAFGTVGTSLQREVGEVLTLLDSRPACKEGFCMDPTRLRHAPHPRAPDSQTAYGKTQ